MNYLLLKFCKSILAFQLQFGTYEVASEHFRWEKEKRHFNESSEVQGGLIVEVAYDTSQQTLGPGITCCSSYQTGHPIKIKVAKSAFKVHSGHLVTVIVFKTKFCHN